MQKSCKLKVLWSNTSSNESSQEIRYLVYLCLCQSSAMKATCPNWSILTDQPLWNSKRLPKKKVLWTDFWKLSDLPSLALFATLGLKSLLIRSSDKPIKLSYTELPFTENKSATTLLSAQFSSKGRATQPTVVFRQKSSSVSTRPRGTTEAGLIYPLILEISQKK